MSHLRSLPSKYLMCCALILSSLTALIALDLWTYQAMTKWMERQFYLFQKTCQTNGITLTTSHMTRQGWPLGARLTLSDTQLHAHYHTRDITVAAPSVQWGGTWGSWLWYALHGKLPPLQLKGLSVLKIARNNATHATFRLQNVRILPALRHSSPQRSFDIALDGGILSTNHFASTLRFISLAGTVYWNAHATQQESQLAINITSQKAQLSHIAFPLNMPLSHVHLATALPGCTPSITTSLAQGCDLRLHDLSADIIPLSPSLHLQRSSNASLSSHIAIGGQLIVPEGSGTLTLQLNHWQNTLFTLLKEPAAASFSPLLLQTLQRNLTPHSSSTSLSSQKPLSFSITLTHGLPTGLSKEKLQALQRLLNHTEAQP